MNRENQRDDSPTVSVGSEAAINRIPKRVGTFLLLPICLLWLAGGCASIPFESVELIPLADTSAQDVISNARKNLPDEFTLMNSIVFNMYGHAVVALGYTAVNLPDNTMSVVALNPMGMKVFEFTDKDGELISSYVIKALAEKGDVAKVIATDIRRMYFDRIPSNDAETLRKKKTFVFTEKRDNDTVRYIFGGADNVLIEKQYYSNNDKLWSVSYHEYQRKNGRLFPAGIVFYNHKRHYRLTASLKEILSIEKSK